MLKNKRYGLSLYNKTTSNRRSFIISLKWKIAFPTIIGLSVPVASRDQGQSFKMTVKRSTKFNWVSQNGSPKIPKFGSLMQVMVKMVFFTWSV